MSSTEIRCLNVNGTAWSADGNVEVLIAEQLSSRNRLFTALGAPTVQAVTPLSAASGDQLVIAGRNLGRVNGDVARVMLGQYECLNVIVLGETSINCVVPLLEEDRVPDLAVVVYQSGGLSTDASSAPLFTYGVAGSVWSDVPVNVQGWRERNDRIIVRWTIPTVSDTEARTLGLEPLTGFRIET